MAQPTTAPRPGVTVVVPTHDAADRLEKMLPAWGAVLARSKRPYEILVVDDGSTDRTPAVVGQMAAGRVSHVRGLKHDTRKGFGACLRTALAEAGQPLLCYVSPDYPYTPHDLFGMLDLTRAFAPSLARAGGGCVVNVLSALSWASLPHTSAYSVSKAAAWALTNGLRNELRAQRTHVLAVHMGYVDTDMARAVDAPKLSPALVAARVLEAVERGDDEVLLDDTARQVKAGLLWPRPLYLGPPL